MRLAPSLLCVALAIGCSSGGGGGGGNGANTPPVARAGPDQTVDVGATVALGATGSSDADGDALAYRWSMSSMPAGSAAVVASADKVNASFVADRPGTYVVRLLVSDGKADSTPDDVQVTAVQGGLLAGDPSGRAMNALTDVPPMAVDPGQIENGVIMTRLDVRLRLDATVGQVNDALTQVGARIVTMRPGFPTITVSIPRPADMAALSAVVQTLRPLPGIRFASLARTSSPRLVPTDNPDFLVDLTPLAPTRFPAAWNAGTLAIASCGSLEVYVLVPDYFAIPPPAAYASRFPAEVPGFVAVPPGETGDSTHGYDVTTTLAALFDPQHPTGANPFPGCLTVKGIQLNGLSTSQEMLRIHRIASELPGSGKFIMNYSQGFWDACEGPCSAATIGTKLHPPLERAYCAADWKMLTHARWGDFLVATAAGNERGEESAAIYPGMGMAPYTSALSMATLADPYFASTQDPRLWGATPAYVGYPSLAATDAEAADLAEYVRTLGLDTVGPAQNVLITGSTTRAIFVDNLRELPDSDSGPDVKAVGQDVFTLTGTKSGTSYAAPQVAGLASYLWLLSPDLRGRPAQDTRQAILANARGNANTTGIIDAYASVLSLDQAVAPTPATAPIRLAILDVDENGVFDESDVELYMRHFYDNNGGRLETVDCGRFDLNGDCITGGTHTDRFDLDREGSTQYGATSYGRVKQNLGTPLVEFDESKLTDAQILCYYAHSALYRGSTTRRNELLRDRCAELTAQLIFPSTIQSGGNGSLQIHAGYLLPDESVQWSGGINVSVAVSGGSADASTGTTDPNGGFSTVIHHDGQSSSIAVTLTAVDADGRQATRSVTATILTGYTYVRAKASAEVGYAIWLTGVEYPGRDLTGLLTTTAPLGPVTQTAGPVFVVFSSAGTCQGWDNGISVQATARAAAETDYGKLISSGSGQGSLTYQHPEYAGYCGANGLILSHAYSEALDMWTITPEDPALNGQVGTMLLDVDSTHGEWPTDWPPTGLHLLYQPAPWGYERLGWDVPPGRGAHTFALYIEFGRSFSLFLSLETSIGFEFQEPPDYSKSYSWSNSVTVSGVRVFQGFPEEGGAPVTGFRLSAGSGHDYGLGHQ